jgi:YD repeat-containing protein
VLSVPGWIKTPNNQSQVTGQVPVTLIDSINVQTGILDVWPVHDPSRITVLAQNLTTQGGGIFYFTPQSYRGVLGFFLKPADTPEPGVYGSLTANGCPLLAQSGQGFLCFLDAPVYAPTTFTYTDPYGTQAVMGTDGTLQQLRDLNNNTLTFTRNGIISSAGNRSVTFTRDGQDRITHITDPAGEVYRYQYDAAGDLTEVDLPELTSNRTRNAVHV